MQYLCHFVRIRNRTGYGSMVRVITVRFVQRVCSLSYEDGSESSVICVISVNRHGGLLYYTLIEKDTFLLYNDAKIMHERNQYFAIDALKDTWGKTIGTLS